ncbi:MAG: class I SAM-dependent methyltransferase [Chitinophagaceae bacterium]
MRWWHYLHFFIYHAWYWNIPLAWFVLEHEIRGEHRYGIRTTQIIPPSKIAATLQQKLHAEAYHPLNYYIAEQLFQHLPQGITHGTFLDIGCGQGRLLCMAAHYGFKQVIGIELDAHCCLTANKNASITQQQFPDCTFDVIHGDASVYSIPTAVQVISLFNPFDDILMQCCIDNVLESLAQHPRKIWILYASPLYEQLWLQAGFRIEHTFSKHRYLQASILTNHY